MRGDKFYEVEMIRDRMGQDLMDAVAFQNYISLAVYNALEYEFEDN